MKKTFIFFLFFILLPVNANEAFMRFKREEIYNVAIFGYFNCLQRNGVVTKSKNKQLKKDWIRSRNYSNKFVNTGRFKKGVSFIDKKYKSVYRDDCKNRPGIVREIISNRKIVYELIDILD